MAGSAGSRQVSPRLIVPALTLMIPALVLVASLLALPPAVPPPAPLPDPAEIAAPLDHDIALIALVPPPAAAPTDVADVAIIPTPTPIPVTPLPTPRATPTPRETWGGPATFTFVALGVDQRNDREIPRTDTIMIGQVDLRAPKVSLISIPRDLLVDIPGYGKDRINAAYVYGEQFKEPGGGIGLLRRTIEQSFGITIDHFGLIDFQCFRTAVDAVGGVTINVPRPIVDPRYPTDDYGTKLVTFEPGLQRMDGERALEYARTRSADNDFHRIQRQQLIIAAMREQLLQLRTLPSVPTLLTGCRNMRSDLGWREYLNLATTLQALNGNRVAFAAIDERIVVDTVLASGAAVLVPRWEPIRALVAESFGTAATAGLGTRTGTGASPTPSLPGASPAPLLLPSPSPTPTSPPLVPPGSIAGPSDAEPLPDDGSALWLPAVAPSRQG